MLVYDLRGLQVPPIQFSQWFSLQNHHVSDSLLPTLTDISKKKKCVNPNFKIKFKNNLNCIRRAANLKKIGLFCKSKYYNYNSVPCSALYLTMAYDDMSINILLRPILEQYKNS